jgi:hypothetical protein
MASAGHERAGSLANVAGQRANWIGQMLLHLPPAHIRNLLDNGSTHKTPVIKQWLEKHPRFKLHFTPTSASWLNAVEGWSAQLERRALYRGVFTSVAELKAAIRQFIEAHNDLSAKPFKWNKTAESIISSVNKAKLGAIKK